MCARHLTPGLMLLASLSASCAQEETLPPPTSAPPDSAGIDPIFVDGAHRVGIDFTHFNGMTGGYLLPEPLGSGAALFDYDRDGDLDAYLVQGTMLEPAKSPEEALFPPPAGPLIDRLYRNDLEETGELRFVDVTEEAGLRSHGYGMGVAAADYDGDGWVDLYVTNLGSNQLWRNRGDGTFADATEKAGVDDPRWSVPAVFFDYDDDGRLDLFLGNYADFNLGTHRVCTLSGRLDYCGPNAFSPQTDRLFRNLGNGAFADVTRAVGIEGDFGHALGALAEDLDGDGRLDLYVANDGDANQMWMNRGERFENRALLGGTALSGNGVAEAGMGVDADDFDNDGDPDLFLTHLTAETNTLYRNDGGGSFHDASLTSGLGAPSLPMTGFGSAWLDYDNDSWLDALVVNGAIRKIPTLEMADEIYPLGQPNQLFRNLGGGVFSEPTQPGGPELSHSEVSRGAAFGDVDNDGDTDVLIVNNSGRCRLLLNQLGQDRSWIGLRLVLGDGHRDALNSRVRVTLADGRFIERRVRTSKGYASSSDPRILIGLGESESLPQVTVSWLGGVEEGYGPLAARQYHVLRRGAGQP